MVRCAVGMRVAFCAVTQTVNVFSTVDIGFEWNIRGVFRAGFVFSFKGRVLIPPHHLKRSLSSFRGYENHKPAIWIRGVRWAKVLSDRGDITTELSSWPRKKIKPLVRFLVPAYVVVPSENSPSLICIRPPRLHKCDLLVHLSVPLCRLTAREISGSRTDRESRRLPIEHRAKPRSGDRFMLRLTFLKSRQQFQSHLTPRLGLGIQPPFPGA